MHKTFFKEKEKITAAEYKELKKNKGRSKYNSELKSYRNVTYQSALEANYAAELDLKIKAKLINSWTRQHKIEFIINDQKITNYYMDFRVITSEGKIEYHEVKGFETPEWQIKWNLLKAMFCELENGNVFAMVLIKRDHRGWIIKREKENHRGQNE
jgi:hypothetical protein